MKCKDCKLLRRYIIHNKYIIIGNFEDLSFNKNLIINNLNDLINKDKFLYNINPETNELLLYIKLKP